MTEPPRPALPLTYDAQSESRGRGWLTAIAVAGIALGALGVIGDSFGLARYSHEFASMPKSLGVSYAYQSLCYVITQLAFDALLVATAIAILARGAIAWHGFAALTIALATQSGCSLAFTLLRQAGRVSAVALSPTMYGLLQSTAAATRLLFYLLLLFLLTRPAVRWFLHGLIVGEDPPTRAL